VEQHHVALADGGALLRDRSLDLGAIQRRPGGEVASLQRDEIEQHAPRDERRHFVGREQQQPVPAQELRLLVAVVVDVVDAQMPSPSSWLPIPIQVARKSSLPVALLVPSGVPMMLDSVKIWKFRVPYAGVSGPTVTPSE
jgi:hypothetical protein